MLKVFLIASLLSVGLSQEQETSTQIQEEVASPVSEVTSPVSEVTTPVSHTTEKPVNDSPEKEMLLQDYLDLMDEPPMFNPFFSNILKSFAQSQISSGPRRDFQFTIFFDNDGNADIDSRHNLNRQRLSTKEPLFYSPYFEETATTHFTDFTKFPQDQMHRDFEEPKEWMFQPNVEGLDDGYPESRYDTPNSYHEDRPRAEERFVKHPVHGFIPLDVVNEAADELLDEIDPDDQYVFHPRHGYVPATHGNWDEDASPDLFSYDEMPHRHFHQHMMHGHRHMGPHHGLHYGQHHQHGHGLDSDFIDPEMEYPMLEYTPYPEMMDFDYKERRPRPEIPHFYPEMMKPDLKKERLKFKFYQEMMNPDLKLEKVTPEDLDSKVERSRPEAASFFSSSISVSKKKMTSPDMSNAQPEETEAETAERNRRSEQNIPLPVVYYPGLQYIAGLAAPPSGKSRSAQEVTDFSDIQLPVDPPGAQVMSDPLPNFPFFPYHPDQDQPGATEF